MATLDRPLGLAKALASLADVEMPAGTGLAVLVIDNSANGSARRAVHAMRPDYRWPLSYVHEPVRGLSHARNAGLAWSLDHGARHVGFLDDDETVDRDWMVELLGSAAATGARAVVGRVELDYEGVPARWVRTAYALDAPTASDGAVIDYGHTGNALIEVGAIRDLSLRFAPELALIGDEDTRFFAQLRAGGVRTVFASNARSYERFGRDRQTLRWWARRWYRQGNAHAFAARRFDDAAPAPLMLRALVRVAPGVIGLALTGVALRTGLRPPLKSLRMTCRGLGMLGGVLGHRFEEYGAGGFRSEVPAREASGQPGGGGPADVAARRAPGP